MIRSVIWSQGLEGVHLTWDEVSQLLDEVYQEPLADID
jgi:hypothetical protein